MQVDLQLAAAEAIMDCMVIATDSSLSALEQRWRGPIPIGLQVLLTSSKDLSLQSSAGPPDHRQAELNTLRGMPSDQAVQVRSGKQIRASHCQWGLKHTCGGTSFSRKYSKKLKGMSENVYLHAHSGRSPV